MYAFPTSALALTIVTLGSLGCGSTRAEPTPSADGGVQDAGAAQDAGLPVDARPTADSAPPDAANPIACGTRGAAPCPGGSFCYRDGNCGEADQAGACVVPPSACPRNLAPVCGCDGRTYDNACMAQASGASVRANGPCSNADAGAPLPDAGGGLGASCGGFAGLGCTRGLFCKLSVGDCVRVGDAMGVCAAVPNACPSVFAPACGCDRRTYSNECVAYAAAQNVASLGACP